MEEIVALPLKWEAIIEAMEDGVCIQSTESIVLCANSAFSQMLDLPKERIVGRTCAEVFGCSGKSVLPVVCAFASSRETGLCKHEEICGNHPGQRLRARISPLHDSGGRVIAFIMVVRDITDVVQRERELAQAKQLSFMGELAAGLAHEIKNPLAGIQGAVDILIRQRDQSDPERTILEGVRREVGRIDGTVRSLLDCASPRPVNALPTSLTEVVRRAVLHARDQIADSSARDHRVQIKFEPVADPIVISIDAPQIEDAVLKLVLNAIESIEGEGSVTVRIYCSNDGESAGEAIVEVEDTGRGIATENMTRIFSPFCTTKKNGTGLGLPAVRRIARAHSGRIEARSALGKGSVFTLRLPLSSQI
jgi:two-component system, NtrC family, nitrogen regulation sensor histidine kinase GlnL